MATSLDAYAPFDAGSGANVTEDMWRKFARLFAPSAVVASQANELKPFGDSTGMQVKVDTGACWIRGHYGESTAGIKTLGIAAAGGIPGGQERWDRIIARADFLNNRLELDILTGTPAAAPGPRPALTQSSSVWEMLLADVGPLVNTTTTITAAMVLDGRWLMTESGILFYRATPSAAASAILPAAGAFPAGYRHARLKWRLRADNAVNNNDLLMTLNGDNGANYDSERMGWSQATGTAAVTEQIGATSMLLGYVPGTNAPANYRSAGEARIDDYNDTGSDKEVYTQSSLKISNAAAGIFVVLATGSWRTTNAAIANALLKMNAGNLTGIITVQCEP